MGRSVLRQPPFGVQQLGDQDGAARGAADRIVAERDELVVEQVVLAQPPQGDGHPLAQVPVLVLSSHSEDGQAPGALPKPCAPERLLASLRAMITVRERPAGGACA